MICKHCGRACSGDVCGDCGRTLVIPHQEPIQIYVDQRTFAPPIMAAPRLRKRRSVAWMFWTALLIPAACCSGLVAIGVHGTNERLREVASVKALVMPELKRHGIVALSDDTEVYRNRNNARLYGMGRTANGQMKRVAAIFTVGDFGGTSKWRIDDLFIDGDSVIE